ncbi:putative N-formylglutamate amidohydrolase [Tritonibacter multivorans]|uniref:Putative N-formylglutamate amidohydrolase n=1 Tax=Tritonibacter multivorans TaxID=928856 RepID=A0A0P1G036_9RHOB|nr:N-formylglutamate amidohydrolase [Tritonibacter multivorans]MDA7422503.1 N-formylglutamate amidohydrolase [Tritonibacter multivorans]CUH74813.1 putative N-formylglutamate amidohydrolase [Tritonibacter multivorans]SFD42061.1 Predicted N-formylglutamate amidohydrolase [Tritonibacter multivorans]
MVDVQNMGLAPFEIMTPKGQSGVVLVCEHASSHIPACYAGLGLAPEDRQSHAAWDPGARALAARLSAALEAPMIAGTVSRLVYDCNRPPDSETAMPDKSERIEVPGNRDLTAATRAARTAQIYDPFSQALSELITAAGPDVVLVTVHSFTPVFHGEVRETELGLLHDVDSRLVDGMLEQASLLPHRCIARNEPYGPQDGVTHTLQRHAIARGVPNAMIEVRNDLLEHSGQIDTIATEILTMLQPALQKLNTKEAWT